MTAVEFNSSIIFLAISLILLGYGIADRVVKRKYSNKKSDKTMNVYLICSFVISEVIAFIIESYVSSIGNVGNVILALVFGLVILIVQFSISIGISVIIKNHPTKKKKKRK